MVSRSSILIGSLLAIAGNLGAQTIQVVGNPVQPGVYFSVILTNTSSGSLPISAEPSFALLQPAGELIVPWVVGCAPVGQSFPPGSVTVTRPRFCATG